MACGTWTCRRRRRRSGPSSRATSRAWRRSRDRRMYDFSYTKPESIPEAVKALGADADAKALAGGQTFIPVLKQRLNRPSTVVDLSELGLTGIAAEADKITIGAMTTHHAIESS